jgi:hypothetical protein
MTPLVFLQVGLPMVVAARYRIATSLEEDPRTLHMITGKPTFQVIGRLGEGGNDEDYLCEFLLALALTQGKSKCKNKRKSWGTRKGKSKCKNQCKGKNKGTHDAKN